TVPQEYAAALAQRNAALRRVQLGLSHRDAIAPWTARVAEAAAHLVEARDETLRALAPAFARQSDELGLADARLGYDAESPTVESLEARLQRDIDRGVTGAGPHLDDVLRASSGSRSSRCSSRRPSCSRRRRCSSSTTCCRSSIPAVAACSRPRSSWRA